jgi:inward rectifier potassium channel
MIENEYTTIREEIDSDLGLGSRIAQESRKRFLNRDGSFNAVRKGLPLLGSLNAFHSLTTMSWTRFHLLVLAGYSAANLFFAELYMLCGPGALEGADRGGPHGRFLDMFFFSVQTLATIGYGRMTPRSIAANFIVTAEALVGLMGFALATGLLFARFSRPHARIVFSDVAVIAPYRDATAFEFRLANARRNELLEVHATVSLARWEMNDGKPVRRFHELSLERRQVGFLPLHWVVVHPITDTSPLRGQTPESLQAADAEFLILLSAVDETFSQSVHARCSYKWNEVIWGGRFADMFVRTADGTMAVDMRRLHKVDRV